MGAALLVSFGSTTSSLLVCLAGATQFSESYPQNVCTAMSRWRDSIIRAVLGIMIAIILSDT